MKLSSNIARIILIVSVTCVTLLLAMSAYQSRIIRKTISMVDETAPAKRASRVDFSTLKSLPLPVRKYFTTVLKDNQPLIRKAQFSQHGKLTTSPKSSGWLPFTARQIVSTPKPGFLWNAKISMAPLLHIRVLDSYIRGKGSGSVLLMSAVKVAGAKDDVKLDSGALLRYLAESPWYPTALLPESGVKWTPLDDRRARATLADSGVTVSVEFTFNDAGEIIKMYTTERYGLFDGEYRQIPWEGRFSDYAEKDGMRIPLRGEVGWHLPEGFWLFWKGEIKEAHYTFYKK